MQPLIVAAEYQFLVKSQHIDIPDDPVEQRQVAASASHRLSITTSPSSGYLSTVAYRNPLFTVKRMSFEV